MRNMQRSDWGGALIALLLIVSASFFGTLAAGLALLLVFGLI